MSKTTLPGQDRIKHDEGFRLFKYRDSLGNWTIGWGHHGRNLPDQITRTEAVELFRGDLAEAEDDIEALLPGLPASPRYDALVNMAFNLGRTRLGRFERMLEAVRREQWNRAMLEALDSRWAAQVGRRAFRIAYMLHRDRHW